MPYFSMAIRSMPMPKAKPEYSSGSMLQFSSTLRLTTPPPRTSIQPVCLHSGWIEVLGGGVVNRKVLENCNIDPDEYSGFAFGIGIERIAMLKYGINNIGLMFENNLQFLKQFHE